MIRKILAFAFMLLSLTAKAQHRSYFMASPDKVQLCINEYGSGKAVVLLPGGPGLSVGYFQDFYARLPKVRFIVPDQRGVGKSLLAKVDASAMAVDRYVADLEALRVHLKLPKLLLVGHFWGGMLAMAYVVRYPHNVERLVLLDPGGADKVGDFFMDNIMMRLLPEDLAGARPPLNVESMKAIQPSYFYSRKKALESRKDITAEIFGQDVGHAMEFANADYAKSAGTRIAALRKFRGPVTLIQGRQDPIDILTAYQTKGVMPQMQLIFIERCGHFPWMEEA